MIINMTGGGGGSGGTLVVTAPLGVTVTATKGNKTYTRVVNAEGNATFRGLSSGTWMLSIDDALHEPSTPVPVVVTADYTVTLNFFSATINVSYPAGSTCTCTDGTITLTAPNTSGSHTFTVPNTGTWTVSSTNGSQTDSEAVSITADGQSASVTLTYFAATIEITYPAASNCVVTDSGGVPVASDSNTGSDAKTWTATVTATGTYTVTATATDGSGNTKSSTVSITADGQSVSVTLVYQLVLFDGADNTEVTGGWSFASNANASGTISDNLIKLNTGNTGARTYAHAYTKNLIDMSEYNTLIINIPYFYIGKSGTQSFVGVASSISSNPTITESSMIASYRLPVSATQPSTLNNYKVSIDISNVNTSGYIYIILYTYGTDRAGALNVSNITLYKETVAELGG